MSDDYLTVGYLLNKFNNVADGVNHLLIHNDRSRNSDTYLQLAYYRAIKGMHVVIPRENIDEVNFEVVRRARQKIQEDAINKINNPRTPTRIKQFLINKVLPRPEVLRDRAKRSKIIRGFISNWHPQHNDNY